MNSLSKALFVSVVVLTSPVLMAPAQEDGERVKKGIADKFREFDRDGNGKLDAAEMMAEPWLPRLDADGDGAVTLEEAQTLLGKLIAPKAPKMPPSITPPPPFTPKASPREEPKRLKPSEHGVGRLIPDLALPEAAGATPRLSEVQGGKPMVIAFFSPTCPISKRYAPTLAALATQYAARGVSLLVVVPKGSDTSTEVQGALDAGGVKARWIADADGAWARALGAEATTDVFLLDAARTLIYRGAIDDQYGLGYSREAPRHRYLVSAVDALLEGRQPEIEATAAPGCVLEVERPPAVVADAPTYHARISRIVQANCQECHRAQGVAPFPLETFEQVSAKAGMVRRMVERGLMPPWFAAPSVVGAHSLWSNDRSLSAEDRTDLLAWLDAGKPAGNPAEAPLARRWPGEWQIGTPDAIVQIPQPLEVKATGTMPYQHVVVETGFAEERWVRAMEVQPTAREVVHHVLVFVQERGKRVMDSALGGFFAAYVPGNNAIIYPEGYAKQLPANSQLFYQIHYTPNGTATRDQVRIGLAFSKEPPEHIVHTVGIAGSRLKIPPGAENHPETASIPVPRAVKLLAFMPHMHLRGKAFRYEVTLPGGDTRTLLEVPRYDFNWQFAYRYSEPPTIPAGSKIRAVGWFDNSTGNPANPDPNKTVRWGPQTTDEMMLGYVEYIIPGEVRLGAR